MGWEGDFLLLRQAGEFITDLNKPRGIKQNVP